jgi:hypothetical protein
MPGGCVVSVLIRLRGKLRSLIGRSDLDVVIPPEVVDDPFAAAITEYASRPEVITAIEIGSSSGAGSTKALFEGMTGRTGVQLYCLELSEPRFAELVARYQDHPWVHCLNATSVSIDAFPSDDEVKEFVEHHGGSSLYDQPVTEVLRWLQQDRDYMARRATSQTGIEMAREAAGVDVFDLVLIDGSEFTGSAELDELHGARYVLLDDTRTFKNYENRRRLIADSDYELVADDPSCRNGFSVFARHSPD